MRITGEEISNNIRAERNRIRLSQDEVASRLGVSLKTYISYEANAKNLNATMLYELAQILECKIDDFFYKRSSRIVNINNKEVVNE